jgi:hypothetical protein
MEVIIFPFLSGMHCDMLPENRDIGFGQYRRIRQNAPLEALRVNG